MTPSTAAPSAAMSTNAASTSFIFPIIGSWLGSILLHKSSIAVLTISAPSTRTIAIINNEDSIKEISK